MIFMTKATEVVLRYFFYLKSNAGEAPENLRGKKNTYSMGCTPRRRWVAVDLMVVEYSETQISAHQADPHRAITQPSDWLSSHLLLSKLR